MFLKYFLFIIIFYASSIKACEKPTMPSEDEWNNWLEEVRKEAIDIGISKKHRVIAKTTYTAVEVSTPHLDDVIRFKDDANRESGKIDDEHKKWWLNDVVRFENESTIKQKNDS